jgi:outer membrane receptor protein involved in Fe transport
MKIKRFILCTACFLPHVLPAQDTTEATSNEEEEVFTLSPFVVDSSKDSGYLASQTLAGTRLATSLKDAPSPVTVLTMDFLEDIDATDINQALAFVPAVDDDPREYNSLNNNPVSTRIRGFQQTSNNVNFFPSRTTTDRYNIDRIDINRGPNAILFGIGNPGGTYVATTKNAELRDNFGWFETRVDTLDSWRLAGDWNQVVKEDRLAIRLAAMTEDKKGFIEPMSDRDERFYGAVTANLVKKSNYDMRLRYQFETVSQVGITRSWALPNDNITAWIDAGSPTFASADQINNPSERWPAGMERMPNAFTVTAVTNGSAGDVPVFIYGNRPASLRTSPDGSGFPRVRIGSPGSKAVIPGTDTPLPIDISYRGPRFGFDLESKSHAVFLEQIFFKKLFTELAWYRQETDRQWDRSNAGQDLYVDVLEYLPSRDANPDNWIPNPNVGQIFTQGHYRSQEQYREIEVTRLTLGYELDLRDSADWMGRHRFGVLLERSRDLLGLNDLVDVNLLTDRASGNNPFIEDLTQFGNRVVRRNYLFTGAGNYWEPFSSPGASSYTKLTGIVDSSSVQSERGDPFETALVNDLVSRGETEVDSWVFSMQSFFPAPGFGNVKERLIPFWGIRGDDLESTQLDDDALEAIEQDPLFQGIYPDWRTVPYDVAATFNDTTLTWGVVYRLTPKWDLFYNSSEVLAPGSSRQNVLGEVIESSTGDGWDAGIRFDLLDGKLVGSLSYFEATQYSIPRFNVFGGQTGDSINNFLEALDGLEDTLELEFEIQEAIIGVANPIDTYDNDSYGFDLEITYNPTPNWRISLRGTKIVNQEFDVLNAAYEHWETYMIPIEQGLRSEGLFDSEIAPDPDKTPRQFYRRHWNEVVNEKFLREGTQAIHSSKYRFTLVTNYRFRQGMLNGFSIGGNLRYASPRSVQAYSLARVPGEPLPDDARIDYVIVDEQWILGLNLGYWKKLRNGVRMNIRLNVSNALDNDDPQTQAADIGSGAVYGVRPVEGREASLTVSFRF